MLDIGSVVDGRFRIDATIGRGGYGVVYRATQLSVDRPVALKVLHASVADGDDAVHRFRREARLTSRIDHPNVVRIIDFGDHHGELYLVMEFVQGPRLQDRIAAGSALSIADAIELGAQIASGLAAAHDEGLVHRDLKPGNVLIRRVDGRDQAVVIDFGLARLHDDAADAADDLVTRSNVMLGTPAYMSPEVVSGTPLDGRSDLYALGVLLFRVVSGQLPFRGRTPIETATRHISAPRPVLACADGTPVPAGLLQLVSSLLARDPDARPASAHVVARRLRAMQTQGPATDATSATPLADPHAPSRTVAAAEPAATITASTVVVPREPAPNGATSDEPALPALAAMPDPTAAARRRGGLWLAGGSALVAAAIAGAVLAPSNDAHVPATQVTSSSDATAGPSPPPHTQSTLPSEAVASLATARDEVAESILFAEAGLDMHARGRALAVETGAIARDALPPPVTPTPVTGPGALSVQAVPWAEVSIDGMAIGETPIERWPLEPGRYTVELRYQDRSRDHVVRIRGGRTTVLDETFDPSP